MDARIRDEIERAKVARETARELIRDTADIIAGVRQSVAALKAERERAASERRRSRELRGAELKTPAAHPVAGQAAGAGTEKRLAVA